MTAEAAGAVPLPDPSQLPTMVAGIPLDRLHAAVVDAMAGIARRFAEATKARAENEAPTGRRDGIKAAAARKEQALWHNAFTAGAYVLADVQNVRIPVLQRLVSSGQIVRATDDTDQAFVELLLCLYGEKGTPTTETACPKCCAVTQPVDPKDSEGDPSVPGGTRSWKQSGRVCADCGWEDVQATEVR